MHVQPSSEGLISDADLEALLIQRGEDAVERNGQGWEVVDAQTSSFVI